MNDSTTAARLVEQLKRFLGRISPQFHKPTIRFVGDMVYGILAEKSVTLADIARSLGRRCSMKKRVDRLSRLLSTPGLDAAIHGAIAREAARRVHGDTLVVIDPSDIQKPYARKMEHLAKVWDGSRGEVGENLGYWGCMAVACESGGRRPVPLHFRIWSAEAPGHVSESAEIESVLDTITEHTNRRGIYVYDRGGDNVELYRHFARKGLDFIVRLKERHVRSWNRTWTCGELAWRCPMRYRDAVKFDSHGRTTRTTLEYGVVPVRLPDLPDRPLHMVVVRGFGRQPMMLLTSLARTTSRKDLWQVVEGYMTRWRVEDTIRHVKQSYRIEDVRLMKYDKLRNLAAVLLAAVYFSMAWIGNSEKHELIASSIASMSLRIHEKPEFHFYAIADGIGRLCARHGRWPGFDAAEEERREEEDTLFAFFKVNTG